MIIENIPVTFQFQFQPLPNPTMPHLVSKSAL
jgi:hypothetical protein